MLAMSGTPAMQAALLPILKAHAAERTTRKAELERRIDGALDAAEEIENNARACLGIELGSVQANQQQLEASAKALRTQVRDRSHQFGAHNDKYDALVGSLDGMGSVATFLQQSDAILTSVRGHFAAIERSLAYNANAGAGGEGQ